MAWPHAANAAVPFGACTNQSIERHELVTAKMRTRLAASVRQARHAEAWLGPTEPCTKRSRFLLTSGREGGEYYRVVLVIELILNKTRNPRRTVVACLMRPARYHHQHPATPSECPRWSAANSGELSEARGLPDPELPDTARPHGHQIRSLARPESPPDWARRAVRRREGGGSEGGRDHGPHLVFGGGVGQTHK